MELLLAEAETGWLRSTIDAIKYALDAFGWPGAIIVLALLGAIWYVRKYGDDHKKEIAARTGLLAVMTEHVPKQSDTLSVIAKNGTEMVHHFGNLTEKVDRVEKAVIAGACPERQELVKAHLHRPDAPQGFMEGLPSH